MEKENEKNTRFQGKMHQKSTTMYNEEEKGERSRKKTNRQQKTT
jgi:hypothetical protein